ncbi:MAG TPA: patatin-like phospholipase family protein [Marmoricola sp.]|nr:patatin-like phospholipase family protein [Marmoricola sp.]HNJ79637.1 patatin-like phospholipase family protein [Marmoricola sp.]HNN48297.1 patatin-like phospholipase family protein [Marmoricola sp.]HNO40315.1 patatin-like phospholipase family protein [Marmoricola sp.]
MGGPFQEKTVWVLSGGGAQGAVQVGMMRALLAAGHAPDAIVATSVGSLNGSFFAVDPTLERLDELAEKWRSVSVTSMFGTKREVVTNVARRRPYLFGNDRLLQVITDWLPATRLEDLKVPMRVATTHLQTGRAVHHDTGEVRRVLAAACAAPALLPPVPLPHRETGMEEMHVDGGLAENLPLSGVVNMPGLDGEVVNVFTLDATHAPRQRELRNPVDALVAALAATLAGQTEYPLLDPKYRITRVKMGGVVGMLNFTRTQELIHRGARAVEESLGASYVLSA